jgi:hypothetical protein
MSTPLSFLEIPAQKRKIDRVNNLHALKHSIPLAGFLAQLFSKRAGMKFRLKQVFC